MAGRVYKKFHGHPPRRQYRRRFTNPKTLVYLGEALYIEYASDKTNGGGDGKMNIFCHRFKRGAKLYTDENSKQLYILGSKIRVTKRGIVN